MADENTEMDKLLKAYKARMHIFHNSEDDNLKDILKSSMNEIKRMTGSDDISIPGIRNLVLERSRYVYNDAAEYFEDNFQSQIIGVSLVVSEKAGDFDEDNVQASDDVER